MYPQDLQEWRSARVKAIEGRAEFKACSSGARRLTRHMVRSRDSLDGSGVFRSPKKLAKEVGVSLSQVRRYLKELDEKGVFIKERRKDPHGTGRRDTTSAYHLRDELLPTHLRCVSVTPLREAPNGDTPKADDTPGDTLVDTPRRSTSYFTKKRKPLRAYAHRSVEVLDVAAYAVAPAAEVQEQSLDGDLEDLCSAVAAESPVQADFIDDTTRELIERSRQRRKQPLSVNTTPKENPVA